MTNFTSGIVATIALVSGLVFAPIANSTPVGTDRLVSNYINPSASTQKVEKAIAKIQDLLEIKCSNNNPKVEAKCDKKKFANTTLVQLRNSKNIRVTIANLAKVAPSSVNKAQVTELGYYQEILRFQSGQNNGQISQVAQSYLDGFDLVSVD